MRPGVIAKLVWLRFSHIGEAKVSRIPMSAGKVSVGKVRGAQARGVKDSDG